MSTRMVLGLDLAKVTMPEAIAAMVEAWLDAQGVEDKENQMDLMPQHLWECVAFLLHKLVTAEPWHAITIAGLIRIASQNEPASEDLNDCNNEYLNSINALGDMGVLVSGKNQELLIMDKCELYKRSMWDGVFEKWLAKVPGSKRFSSESIPGTIIPLHFVDQFFYQHPALDPLNKT